MRKIINYCFALLAVGAVVYGLVVKHAKASDKRQELSKTSNDLVEDILNQETTRITPEINIPQN